MEGNSACSLSILNVSIKKITGPLGEGTAGEGLFLLSVVSLPH